MGTMIDAHDQALRARRRWPLRFVVLGLAGAAVVGGMIGVVLHLTLGTRTTRAAPGAPTLEGQAVWAAGRTRRPTSRCATSGGSPSRSSGQRGRIVVLAFMDSRCRQVCPLEGRVLARAIDALPPDTKPTLLVVSVNPWADTRSSAFAAAGALGLRRVLALALRNAQPAGKGVAWVPDLCEAHTRRHRSTRMPSTSSTGAASNEPASSFPSCPARSSATSSSSPGSPCLRRAPASGCD